MRSRSQERRGGRVFSRPAGRANPLFLPLRAAIGPSREAGRWSRQSSHREIFLELSTNLRVCVSFVRGLAAVGACRAARSGQHVIHICLCGLWKTDVSARGLSTGWKGPAREPFGAEDPDCSLLAIQQGSSSSSARLSTQLQPNAQKPSAVQQFHPRITPAARRTGRAEERRHRRRRQPAVRDGERAPGPGEGAGRAGGGVPPAAPIPAPAPPRRRASAVPHSNVQGQRQLAPHVSGLGWPVTPPTSQALWCARLTSNF